MLMVSHRSSSLSPLKFENKKGWNPLRIPALFQVFVACWITCGSASLHPCNDLHHVEYADAGQRWYSAAHSFRL